VSAYAPRIFQGKLGELKLDFFLISSDDTFPADPTDFSFHPCHTHERKTLVYLLYVVVLVGVLGMLNWQDWFGPRAKERIGFQASAGIISGALAISIPIQNAP
jgi:hypothetical protein